MQNPRNHRAFRSGYAPTGKRAFGAERQEALWRMVAREFGDFLQGLKSEGHGESSAATAAAAPRGP